VGLLGEWGGVFGSGYPAASDDDASRRSAMTFTHGRFLSFD
jgi:hypothetical protein